MHAGPPIADELSRMTPEALDRLSAALRLPPGEPLHDAILRAERVQAAVEALPEPVRDRIGRSLGPSDWEALRAVGLCLFEDALPAELDPLVRDHCYTLESERNRRRLQRLVATRGGPGERASTVGLRSRLRAGAVSAALGAADLFEASGRARVRPAEAAVAVALAAAREDGIPALEHSLDAVRRQAVRFLLSPLATSREAAESLVGSDETAIAHLAWLFLLRLAAVPPEVALPSDVFAVVALGEASALRLLHRAATPREDARAAMDYARATLPVLEACGLAHTGVSGVSVEAAALGDVLDRLARDAGALAPEPGASAVSRDGADLLVHVSDDVPLEHVLPLARFCPPVPGPGELVFRVGPDLLGDPDREAEIRAAIFLAVRPRGA